MIKNTRLSRVLANYALAGALAFVASGCSDTTLGSKSFEEETTFDIPTIGGISGITITLPDIAIPVNLANLPGYEQDDLNYVTGVKIRSIVFEIGPDSSDATYDSIEDGNLDSFEFVSELKIGLAGEVGGQAAQVDVASLPMNDPQVASNAQSVNLTVADVDIRDIIENPAGAQLLISVTGNPPPDKVQVNAKISYRVNIGIR